MSRGGHLKLLFTNLIMFFSQPAASSAAVPHCTDWHWHLMLSPMITHQLSDSSTPLKCFAFKKYGVFKKYDQGKKGHNTYQFQDWGDAEKKDRYRYHDAMMLQHFVLQTYSTLISFAKVGEQKKDMNDKMLGMVWHCVSLAHLLSFLGRWQHVGARARGWCCDRRRWKDASRWRRVEDSSKASMPGDNHILYPGLFLRLKLKLPRTMGYFFPGYVGKSKGMWFEVGLSLD